MIGLDKMLDKIRVGNDAGWALFFYRDQGGGQLEAIDGLGCTRNDYYAEIDATLPAGLEAGTYTFTIEGMTDDQYAKLRKAMPSKDQPKPCVAKLYLYWRDANASVVGYLKNLASLADFGSGPTEDQLQDFLVAVLEVTDVSRKAGARRYEATIKAGERVFKRLIKRLPAPLELTNFADGVPQVQKLAGITVHPHLTPLQPAAPGPKPGSEKVTFKKDTTLATVLTELAKYYQQVANKYGRGMFLIRDGALEFGARTMDADIPKPLTLENGLLQVDPLASVSTDPKVKLEETDVDASAIRKQYQLTLKGRPDLKPGDVVTFDVLPEDSKTVPSVVGALGIGVVGSVLQALGAGDGSEKVKAYVNSVQHKLGRKSGFSTVATVVELKDGDEQWTPPTGTGASTGDDTAASGASANPGVEAAKAVQKIVDQVLAKREPADVGEVRAMTVSGSAEPPGQTLTVWQGLEAADGKANQARRLDIDRKSPAPLRDVAYVTPFAFGKCGLVLPRYPGTRVLMVHRHGELNDAVDVGAIWESGHGPDSQAGDWWLILPAAIPSGNRASIADTDTPQEPSGKATNDLIDADGNRLIEVGNFTIRVGPGKLQAPGTRPTAPASSQLVTIEVGSATSIVIDDQGTITMKAGKDIVLDASSGHITLKAQTVDVKG
jgi:hypothetical protein